MMRLPLCALSLVLALTACGREPAPAESGPEIAATPAAEAPAPVPTAVPDAATAAPDAATGESDGETVEAPTVATSPIATAIAANTPAPEHTPAWRWKAGEHYTALTIAQPVGTPPGTIEVVEGFWYGCAHCFALEPQLEAWERSKPGWIELRRLPVVWNEVTREDARLYFTIESLGLVDKLHPEVFRELHVRGRPLTVISGNRVDAAATEKAARDFLLARGVSAEDFGRHYRTFSTENRLRQAENLSRRYPLDHTPTIVVQGKYLTDVSMAGGPGPLFQLINDLAAREHGAP